MNPLRILLRDAKVETLMQAIPAERLRALILEQTDGRLDLLLSQPDPETRVDAHGDPEWDESPLAAGLIDARIDHERDRGMQAAKNATAEQAAKAKASRVKRETKETPPEPSVSQDALDAVLLAVGPFSATVGVIADKAGMAPTLAGRALNALKARGLVNDNVAPGAYFITTDGRDAQDALRPEEEPEAISEAEAPAERTDLDGTPLTNLAATTEPARGDDSPASEADVLGALLEGKPQTIAAIASYLELGVARVTPTVLALVEAGKVERAPTKGRYPQWQKVAS